MTIYVSPAERSPHHKRLGVISSVPEEYGMDFFWIGDSGKTWGVQRKAFPADLRASLDDGRFAKELNQMLAVDYPWFVFEGYRSPTDGFTTTGLTAIEARLQIEGIGTQWTRDHKDTAEYIEQLYKYSMKPAGESSLRRRPAGPTDEWKQRSKRMQQMWIAESFDGISQGRAGAMIDWFRGLPLMWTVTRQEMLEVPGLGPKIVDKLFSTLEALNDLEAEEVRVD